MTPKEYLQRYQTINTRINELCEDVTRLRSIAAKCTVSFGGTGGGDSSERIPRCVEKIEAAEKQIDALIDELLDIKGEITSTIESLADERYRHVLALRYISGKTFEQIAVEMNYSWRQVIRLHGEALQAVKDVIECHVPSVL